MHTGDVVNLFEGKRGNRSVKRYARPTSLKRAWTMIASLAAAVAEVARESRALERRLLDQGGYRRFVDR